MIPSSAFLIGVDAFGAAVAALIGVVLLSAAGFLVFWLVQLLIFMAAL